MMIKFKLKTTHFSFPSNQLFVLFHPKTTKQFNIKIGSSLKNLETEKTFHVIESELIEPDFVYLPQDVADDLMLKEGQSLSFLATSHSTITDLVHKQIRKESLTKKDFENLITAVNSYSFVPEQLAAFGMGLELVGLTDEETALMAEAIYTASQVLDLSVDAPIVDKHSIGGIAGNRITPIIVPIIAAAGIYIPKVSTRAITSSAGSIDCVELFMPTDLTLEEMREVVLKTNGCIVDGEHVELGKAADILIKSLSPLKLDPKPFLVASILAKKKAASSEFVLIDLPTGKLAKVADKKEARILANLFTTIGMKLGMYVECVVSPGDRPIGHLIGPALEAKDALMVLENNPNASEDLKKKALALSGLIFEMTKRTSTNRGVDLAKSILESGKALEKLKEIITAQGGDPSVTSEVIPTAPYSDVIKAEKEDVVYNLDSVAITAIARAAGAPQDPLAGIELLVDRGDHIRPQQALFKIYSSSETRLSEAVQRSYVRPPVILEKMVLDVIRPRETSHFELS